MISPDAMTEEEYLAHFGVKGQKWGVIRSNLGSAASSTADGAKKAASSTKAAITSEQGKKYVKVGAKVAGKTVKYGAAAGLSVSGLGIVGTIAMDPDVQRIAVAGKDYTKLVLNEVGLNRMSQLEKVKSYVNVRATFGGNNSAANRARLANLALNDKALQDTLINTTTTVR